MEEKQEKEKGNFWLTVASFILKNRKSKENNFCKSKRDENPERRITAIAVLEVVPVLHAIIGWSS